MYPRVNCPGLRSANTVMCIYLDVREGRGILATKRDSIARFIHVIRPLRTLYKLPATSVHIFYDMQGDSIAFNRNASIFLNLRYYEAWRRCLSLWYRRFPLTHFMKMMRRCRMAQCRRHSSLGQYSHWVTLLEDRCLTSTSLEGSSLLLTKLRITSYNRTTRNTNSISHLSVKHT